ncbi:kinase [Arsukibacterium indicum]|uniref:Kinase n=1 Tax=Arsukibacterium indicum TaxID=2848612 RepID=A0ABS6MPS4_9GAMM|nr:kinase [Arsukibacterium indicum]MBV2130346.1 kinase [Arsukibacterium indicum]
MADFRASTDYQTTLAQLVQKLQSKLCFAYKGPAVIGISGAQGSGKSTLAAMLVQQFSALGIKAATVSLDDYYLNKAQRRQLALQVHPMLHQRGVPGTHDIQQAIADAETVLAGRPVVLPQFDKALDEPGASLPAQQLDLLIVEGWCLGVRPQTEAELAPPLNQLEATADADGRWRSYVNARLAADYADYWRLLKPLIWLNAPDWECICRWRAKQEQQLWQQRGSGMTDTELARFMLPFQRLTQASWQQLPGVADVIVQLDTDHQPTLLATDKLQHRL